MRDTEIYRQFGAIAEYVGKLEVALKTALTGEAVQNEALKRVLIQKGLLTTEEWTKIVGEVLVSFNEAATKQNETKPEEEQKPALVTPSPAEVAKVEESKNS